LSASGRRRKAVALLRSTANSHPDSAEVWCRLAAALLDRGDAVAALVAVRRAMPLGGDKAWAHRLAGKALSRLGRHQEAVAAARQAVRAAPCDWRCRIALAEAFGAAGSWPDAVDAAAQAVRYQPDHVRPYLVLGDAARRTGDLATAERAYRAALRRKPGDPRIRAELARLRQVSPRSVELPGPRRPHSGSAALENFGKNLKFSKNQPFVTLDDVDQPSGSGELTAGRRSARPWTTSSDGTDDWRPRRFAHDPTGDHCAADHPAADYPVTGNRAGHNHSVFNRLIGNHPAGERPAVNYPGAPPLDDYSAGDQPARGRTSGLWRNRAFRQTSPLGRTPADDRPPLDGRPSPSRWAANGRPPADRSAADRAEADHSSRSDHSSRADRSSRVDHSSRAGRSSTAGRSTADGRSSAIDRSTEGCRSPVVEKLAWRVVRQVSVAVVVAGMFLMVAGLPKPTPVLAWLGFAIPCVVLVVAVVELFRVPAGLRFAVLTMPLRRPVIALAGVLLALANALVLLWAMLDRVNAGTMEPLIFALVCAVCAGAVSLVNEV
jgi:Flp pilus assembly protein TadD